MNSRVVQYVQRHYPLEVIKELKLSNDDAKAALDLSISQGRWDLAAYFLNSDVPLPLVDSELGNRYALLAKCLGASGANTLPTDPIVSEGLYFRALSQNETILSDRVLPHVFNPHDFVPLALEEKNSKAAETNFAALCICSAFRK
jgi:hypothetical protein